MESATPSLLEVGMSEGAESWLVVLLQPLLTMALSPVNPGSKFIVNGATYRTAYRGDVVATFDRLIDDSGRLIGIQIWPVAAHTGQFLAQLPAQPYLRVADDGSHFQLHFSGVAVAEGESTGEQSVVGQIYRTDSGEYAIATDLNAILYRLMPTARLYGLPTHAGWN